jgi:hypothetical protein
MFFRVSKNIILLTISSKRFEFALKIIPKKEINGSVEKIFLVPYHAPVVRVFEWFHRKIASDMK